MNKPAILTATAIIALTTAGASVAASPPLAAFTGPRINPITRHTPGLKVLYNQNSGANGNYINSQNYTSGTYASYNDQGADDFVVPAGKTWKVKEIDVTGCCSGSPISENVFFYKDKNGAPGKPVRHGSFTDLQGTGAPSFAISLGKGVKLKAGHYWVSVVANCSDTGGCGDWGWAMTSTINNDAALWQQPGNGAGTGCTSWSTLSTCFGSGYAGDFLFELQGKSK